MLYTTRLPHEAILSVCVALTRHFSHPKRTPILSVPGALFSHAMNEANFVKGSWHPESKIIAPALRQVSEDAIAWNCMTATCLNIIFVAITPFFREETTNNFLIESIVSNVVPLPHCIGRD